jgi:hypothetical protein
MYDLSVLAFLNPGFPHSNSDYLRGAHFSGFDEFFSRQLENVWNSSGHSFLTINILGALASYLGNLKLLDIVLDSL